MKTAEQQRAAAANDALLKSKAKDCDMLLKSKAKDYDILAAMDLYGGGFVKSLAICARRADSNNLLKLKLAFSDYWTQYGNMAAAEEEHNDKEQDRRNDIEEDKRAEAWLDKQRDAECEARDEEG